jgi:hypothetical protein
LPLATAQGSSATLNGQITDANGRVVPNTEVQAVNIDTNVVYPTKTNNVGLYTIASLPPGRYRVHVKRDGFKEVNLTGLDLHTQDALEQNFSLEVGSTSESVTVQAGATNENPAVSLTVTREFIENMPLNGESFQDLIQLAPGTVSSQNGYYSIDGQRADANNYTVDGVSANQGGINNHTPGNDGIVGSSPSQTMLGTTQSLASIDSLQEFTIQTAGYAAEYGRSPGGQVGFTTRSGTNAIHGTLFEYLRNTAFDANSYFNDYHDIPQTAEHQNDFGGTIGGPFIVPGLYDGKNKSFYFFSYEGLRLLLPSFESEYVPTQALRQSASPYSQPYLNSQPLPNQNSPGNDDGCTIADPTSGQPTACDALFTYGYSYPSQLDNISVRGDQTLGGRLHVFARYSNTPSFESVGAELVTTSTINTHTWTAGATANISSAMLDEFRFNYSHDGEGAINSQKPVGGSVPVARNLLIPEAYDGTSPLGAYFAYVPGTSLSFGTYYGGGGTTQNQYQIVDSLAWTRGEHDLKFGGDWRRVAASYADATYESEIESESLSDIQQGYATELFISALASGQPVFDDLSLYAQDHWRRTPRLSIDYGLRWEFNPPPGPSNDRFPITLTSSNLTSAQVAPSGNQPYKTNYHSFAPRIGFAWNRFSASKHPLTVRGGFGIFYDTGQNVVGAAYVNAYPFTVSRPDQLHIPLPLPTAASAPPSLNFPLTPPYPYLQGISSPDLTLPYTEQWNLSVDEALNAKNTLTLSYVGNNGRKLLFSQYYGSVPGNPTFSSLLFTTNASQSSYNALQVQDSGRIANGLDLVASFTFAHALDNASNEALGYAPQWGNSTYDLRRALNVALNYQSPAGGSSRWLEALSHGWLVTNRFSAQSGYPLNIIQSTIILPDGSQTQYAPDLVSGVPIYLHGRAADVAGQPVPGNWRLNRAAFACTTSGATSGPCVGTPVRQGTLGRDYVRTPPFWTLNTALQRSFPIYEQLRLNFRVDAFNIINHPSLGSPTVYSLGASTFGQPAGITTIGSSNQLYAMGAARSLQFSMKLQF